MAATFLNTSSQRILNTASPVTAFPYSVGFWANPTTLGANRTFWSLSNTGATNQVILSQRIANVFQLNSLAASTNTASGTFGTVSNQWFYFIIRVSANVNRRVDSLSADGTAASIFDNVASAPSAMASVALGANADTTGAQFFTGSIAEYWMTNTDIQPDGLQTQNAMLRQLAFGGPFSVPHIAKDICDYRSFRTALDSSHDDLSDYDMGNKGRQTWVNTNGVILGAHPPLPSGYRGPSDQIKTGIV